jgi:hypothetical protein
MGAVVGLLQLTCFHSRTICQGVLLNCSLFFKSVIKKLIGNKINLQVFYIFFSYFPSLFCIRNHQNIISPPFRKDKNVRIVRCREIVVGKVVSRYFSSFACNFRKSGFKNILTNQGFCVINWYGKVIVEGFSHGK